MFKQARLKLTAWYLLIIMSVSLAFSAVIYRAADRELERFAQAQREKFEKRVVIPGFTSDVRMSPVYLIDDELLDLAMERILQNLIFINLGILGLASFLGYYLSGKTLAPIQEMMGRQYRFVTDASHELKTPITAIKTILEVAKRDKNLDLTEAKQIIDDSLAEINRMQVLTEGLLELANKQRSPKMTTMLVKPVVDSAIKIIKPIVAKKEIEVVSQIETLYGELNKASMVRVLVALLDNAVKYSPHKSTITIHGRKVGTQIVITIVDQGVGIGKQDIPHIFDRFYRTDPARSASGYGLGLSIAKGIVEEHGGTIYITSKLNKGTKVTIKLPIVIS